MSAQPVYEEPDPRNPEVIAGLLPPDERVVFLNAYKAAAAAAANDVTRYRDLQRFLGQWRLAADAAHDPRYHEALAEARAATGPGLSLDELDRFRRVG